MVLAEQVCVLLILLFDFSWPVCLPGYPFTQRHAESVVLHELFNMSSELADDLDIDNKLTLPEMEVYRSNLRSLVNIPSPTHPFPFKMLVLIPSPNNFRPQG